MNAHVAQTHHVSQDLTAPFGIELDGQLVAEFTTEAESNAYLARLVARLRAERR